MARNNQNIKGVDELIAKLQAAKHYLRTDVFDVIGVEAVNQFKRNFDQEGFEDRSVNKWASRKSKRPGSTNGQKILTKSGDLAESITYEKKPPAVIIQTDKPYAELHNEGGEITVTDKMRKFFWAKHKEYKDGGDMELADQYKAFALSKKIVIPKRQFMGQSETLNNNIVEKIMRDLNRILN